MDAMIFDATRLSFPVDPPGGAAGMFYSRIETGIENEYEDLEEGEELSVICYPSAAEPIIVESFGYHGPVMLYIYGRDPQGNPATVMAHPHAVQIVMKRIRTNATETPARRIGFLNSATEED